MPQLDIARACCCLYQVMLIASIALLGVTSVLFFTNAIRAQWVYYSAGATVVLASLPACLIMYLFMVANAGVFVGVARVKERMTTPDLDATANS